jgi:UDP-glucose 4-epimerase
MILLIGGLGFIGSHVTRALLDLGRPCVLAQRRTGGVPDLLAGEIGGMVSVERADVTDLKSLLAVGERHEITGIVYLAGTFGTDPGDPVGGVRAGLDGLVNLFEAAVTWGVSRVGLASTIGVYDVTGDGPLREDLPLPMTAAHPIPAAKKVGELVGDHLGGATGLEVHHYRIGAVWGPLGRPASRFFAVPQLVHRAVRGTAPALSGPGPSGADPSGPAAYADDGMDTIYVKDCGRAIALLHTAERLRHRTYNVSGGRATTYREFAAAITSVVPDAEIELREGRDPDGLGRDVHLDISRLRDDTGYRPAYDTEAAVRDYVAWLRAGHER